MPSRQIENPHFEDTLFSAVSIDKFIRLGWIDKMIEHARVAPLFLTLEEIADYLQHHQISPLSFRSATDSANKLGFPYIDLHCQEHFARAVHLLDADNEVATPYFTLEHPQFHEWPFSLQDKYKFFVWALEGKPVEKDFDRLVVVRGNISRSLEELSKSS